MADIIKTNVTSSSMTARIQNLQYIASDYDDVYFECKDTNGNVIDSFYEAPPSGSNYYIDWTVSGLSAHTWYSIDAWITYAGTGYYIGYVSNYTRPNNYGTTFSAGNNICTATQWNDLLDTIGYMRQFKNLSWGTMTYVSSGDSFLASYFNQQRSNINDMSPSTSVPSSVSSGGTIYASALNGLVNSLNSVTW